MGHAKVDKSKWDETGQVITAFTSICGVVGDDDTANPLSKTGPNTTETKNARKVRSKRPKGKGGTAKLSSGAKRLLRSRVASAKRVLRRTRRRGPTRPTKKQKLRRIAQRRHTQQRSGCCLPAHSPLSVVAPPLLLLSSFPLSSFRIFPIDFSCLSCLRLYTLSTLSTSMLVFLYVSRFQVHQTSDCHLTVAMGGFVR